MMKISVLAVCTLLLAVPLLAANKSISEKRSEATALRNYWPPETLTGKIMSVDPATHLVIVQDSTGVPFDMIVTLKTRIEQGTEKLDLQNLSSDTNKQVSVHFTPERRGDVASTIQMNG